MEKHKASNFALQETKWIKFQLSNAKPATTTISRAKKNSVFSKDLARCMWTTKSSNPWRPMKATMKSNWKHHLPLWPCHQDQHPCCLEAWLEGRTHCLLSPKEQHEVFPTNKLPWNNVFTSQKSKKLNHKWV